MSKKGDCWDNAVAESFFGSLKQERCQWRHYQTRYEAQQDILQYIADTGSDFCNPGMNAVFGCYKTRPNSTYSVLPESDRFLPTIECVVIPE